MSCRLLVVDDDATLRGLLLLLLGTDDRFTVVGEAEDGVEALAMVDTYDPDLVLLDLAMPRMDGLQVLEHLEGRPRPVVAVLTGFVEEQLHEQALAAGAALCLEKGADFADLPDRLAALQAGA